MNRLFKEKRASISSIFYQKTKIKRLPKEDFSSEDWPTAWKRIYTKEYPRLTKILLPTKIPRMKDSFSDILLRRKSQRAFTNKKISLDKLAYLLYYSGGIIPDGSSFDRSRRYYPSAGARYPLEIYISTNKVIGLRDGLYHYSARSNVLDSLWIKKDLNKLIAKNIGQNWVSNSSVIIMVSAVFQRNQTKYGGRGLRYIFLEAGHLGQNFYLAGTALGLKICTIGGFIDDKINEIVDIDGDDEGVLYILSVGI